MEEQKPKGSGMEKIATFIVDKRNLFFLLYAFALIFSIVATGWVKVENDITTSLPEDTATRQGLTVMNDNFVTYGTARVMVSNVTYETAENICSDLESIDGVTSVDFDDTTDHYKSASALFSVTQRTISASMRCIPSGICWPGTIPILIPKSAWIPPQTCKAR